jgi:hypothetical protein
VKHPLWSEKRAFCPSVHLPCRNLIVRKARNLTIAGMLKQECDQADPGADASLAAGVWLVSLTEDE